MIRLIRTTAIAGMLVATSPAMSEDGFMAIHMQNQQIGAAVFAYWHEVALAAAPTLDGFASIHLDNQKIGSAVTSYWQSLSAPTDEMTATAD